MKKKVLWILLAAVGAFALSYYASYGYFTDAKATKATLTIGKFSSKLVEDFPNPNGAFGSEQKDKIFWVENTGNIAVAPEISFRVFVEKSYNGTDWFEDFADRKTEIQKGSQYDILLPKEWDLVEKTPNEFILRNKLPLFAGKTSEKVILRLKTSTILEKNPSENNPAYRLNVKLHYTPKQSTKAPLYDQNLVVTGGMM